MSTAVSRGIYRRLNGDEDLTGYPDAIAARTSLIALLGTDEGGAAILQGNVDRDVTFPQITFRPSGGTTTLDGHDLGRRVRSIYDMEYWESNGRPDIITDIDAQVEKLLDMRFRLVPVLPLNVGECFWSEAFTDLQMFYNETVNAWFGLRRWSVEEARV